jgi:tetratricopeptide (TPR) repeat protein
MRRHVLPIGAAVLAAQLLLTPAALPAQQVAYASLQGESAQSLATQALECLRRGDDGLTKQSRMAAYREGWGLAQRAVAADDRNADAHFAVFANHGRLLLEEGTVPNPFNMVEVNRELERALQLNPNHVDALISRGGLYRQLPWLLGGSLKKAEACLTRAIELDANAVGGRIELAATYRDMGQPERGVPLLEKAIEVAQQVGKFRQLNEARALLAQCQPKR